MVKDAGLARVWTHFQHNRKCRFKARMATNGILLYAMKKPNDGKREPRYERNRLIEQKNVRDDEFRCFMA